MAGRLAINGGMPAFGLPTDYPRVRRVNSFRELASTPLTHGVNALCWPRTLPGDYPEVLRLLTIPAGEAITVLDEARLQSLPVSAAGRVAVDQLLADQRQLRDLGLDPALNCISGYPRDEQPGPVATDVFSFHADSAEIEADTWLCTYWGPASEGLRNEEAQRHVDIPATRAALLRHYGGPDDEDFLGYLREHCYDLHYAPAPAARLFPFGQGNLWRIALDYPGNPVPPCIHRAPATFPGQPPRLLLIS